MPALLIAGRCRIVRVSSEWWARWLNLWLIGLGRTEGCLRWQSRGPGRHWLGRRRARPSRCRCCRNGRSGGCLCGLSVLIFVCKGELGLGTRCRHLNLSFGTLFGSLYALHGEALGGLTLIFQF